MKPTPQAQGRVQSGKGSIKRYSLTIIFIIFNKQKKSKLIHLFYIVTVTLFCTRSNPFKYVSSPVSKNIETVYGDATKEICRRRKGNT